MPSEDELFADLERFLAIYRNTVEARDRILATRPGEFHTASRARNIAEAAEPDPEPLFRPKDSGEYLASVRAQRQRRTRRHEDLVRQFGEHVRGQGWTAATNVHPRDLVLRHGASEFLVEAEVVRNNAEHAVREAIVDLTRSGGHVGAGLRSRLLVYMVAVGIREWREWRGPRAGVDRF